VGPDGRRWRVRRLLFPRVRGTPSLDGVGDAGGDLGTVAGDAGLVGIAAIVLAVLVLVFLPYVFFALELLVVPLLFAYRVVLGKPWTVEARSGSERLRWHVRGWRRAGDVAEGICRSLERGEPPEPHGATPL